MGVSLALSLALSFSLALFLSRKPSSPQAASTLYKDRCTTTSTVYKDLLCTKTSSLHKRCTKTFLPTGGLDVVQRPWGQQATQNQDGGGDGSVQMPPVATLLAHFRHGIKPYILNLKPISRNAKLEAAQDGRGTRVVYLPPVATPLAHLRRLIFKPESKIRNQKSETRNQKPETRNLTHFCHYILPVHWGRGYRGTSLIRNCPPP